MAGVPTRDPKAGLPKGTMYFKPRAIWPIENRAEQIVNQRLFGAPKAVVLTNGRLTQVP